MVAWQVEHEAVDPLGLRHSWRLPTSFVEEEVQPVRAAGPLAPASFERLSARYAGAGSSVVAQPAIRPTRPQWRTGCRISSATTTTHGGVLSVRGWSLYLAAGARRAGRRALGRAAANAHLYDRGRW